MSLKGKEVLIIDDTADNRLLCRKILETLGIIVTEASSSEEGEKILAKKNPHLIILDLNMPGKSGFEFLVEKRSSPTLSMTPVIVVSGLTDRESIVKAIGLGATDYLVKPLKASILVGKIRKNLRGQDFKRYKLTGATQMATMSVGATLTAIEEGRVKVESPIRLREKTKITLSQETLTKLGAEKSILMTGDEPGTKGFSKFYVSWIEAIGLARPMSTVIDEEEES